MDFILPWCFTSTETVGFIRDGASVFRPLKALESSFDFPMPLKACFFVRGLFSDCACVCWGGGGVLCSFCVQKLAFI